MAEIKRYSWLIFQPWVRMRDASGRPLKPTITRASSKGCAAAIPMVIVLERIKANSRIEAIDFFNFLHLFCDYSWIILIKFTPILHLSIRFAWDFSMHPHSKKVKFLLIVAEDDDNRSIGTYCRSEVEKQLTLILISTQTRARISKKRKEWNDCLSAPVKLALSTNCCLYL